MYMSICLIYVHITLCIPFPNIVPILSVIPLDDAELVLVEVTDAVAEVADGCIEPSMVVEDNVTIEDGGEVGGLGITNERRQ